MTDADAALFAAGLRVSLAVVFAVSGLAKLRDPAGTRAAVEAFGVPRAVRQLVATGLPFVELALAAGLLTAGTAARVAALSAVALLAVFAVGIALTLSRGEAPACHCFGTISAKPVSRLTVVRNSGLAALALPTLLLADGDRFHIASAFSRLGASGRTDLYVLIIACVGAASTLHLHRRLAQLDVEVKELRAGMGPAGVSKPAPDFELSTTLGGTTSLDDLLALGKPLVLLFMSPECGPCRALAPDVAVWAEHFQDHLSIAVLSSGALGVIREEFGERSFVLVDEGGLVARSFGVDATPGACLVMQDKRILFDLAYGDVEIRALVSDLAPEPPQSLPHHHPEALPVGAALPRVELHALTGTSFNVPDDLPAHCDVLFWDPDCTFANGILDDIRRIDAEPRADRPLVVVSGGEASDPRIRSFASTTLLDPSFALGNALRFAGTPSAVRVSDGRIASHLAVGGTAVIELLKSAPQQTPSHTS